VLWGGWLLATAAIYSVMSGVIHPYYTNALAPPIAVLTGVGSVLLWRRRERLAARLTLAAMLGATGVWAFALLDRTPNWHPWLRYAVLVAAVGAGIVVVVRGARLKRRAAGALAATALFAALAAPAAFTLNAIATVQTGTNPVAGPASASQSAFGGTRAMPSGATSGAGAMPTGAPGGADGAGVGGVRFTGGGGGSLTAALANRLEQNASRYRWVAATSSAQTAASIELSTGTWVMAIGGFTGSDNATTLAQFKRLVAGGKIHYYVSGGGGGPGAMKGNAQSVSSQIESWVSKHFTSITVGGTTVYDLTQTTSS
jgi:4-amino-4-deoxy-L-arabinose transferase-like glycosyltransferase